MKAFNVWEIERERPVIIYGTGIYGKLLFYGLHQMGISVRGFADRNKKESFMGYPVLDLAELKTCLAEEIPPMLLLGVTRALQEIVEQIESVGITEYYNAYSVLEAMELDKDCVEPDIKNAYHMRWMYDYYQRKLCNNEALYLTSLDLVVSEKCSLRCKDCSNLMQYYQRPNNVDINKMRESLERLLNQITCIGELRILGGEPFMNPDFYKIIQWYADDDRIMKIGIYTNATIFPKEEVLQCIKHKNVVMHLSDYGVLSRELQHWINFCEENAVAYVVTQMDWWHDCGKLEKRNYSEESIKGIYQICECRELPTFLHGRLYNCPYAANAVNLGALTKDEAAKDFLSFRSSDNAYSAKMIKAFLYGREYLAACDYCSGRNFDLKKIPAHIQAKEPLPYKRRDSINDNN